MSKETIFYIFVPGSENSSQQKAEEMADHLAPEYDSEIIQAEVHLENVIEGTSDGGPKAVIVKSTKK